MMHCLIVAVMHFNIHFARAASLGSFVSDTTDHYSNVFYGGHGGAPSTDDHNSDVLYEKGTAMSASNGDHYSDVLYGKDIDQETFQGDFEQSDKSSQNPPSNEADIKHQHQVDVTTAAEPEGKSESYIVSGDMGSTFDEAEIEDRRHMDIAAAAGHGDKSESHAVVEDLSTVEAKIRKKTRKRRAVIEKIRASHAAKVDGTVFES